MANMRCEEVQDLASGWLDRELSDGRARMVAEHETQCDACRAYIADLRLLSDQMKRFAKQPAPAGLEERIRLSLAEEQGWAEEQGRAEEQGWNAVPAVRGARAQPIIHWLTSIAAVCLLSVFGTWAVVHQPEAVATTQHDVVAAHVRSLLQDSTVQVVSSDRHTVRPWFSGKVEFAPPVKDLAAEGFPLVGGRLDYVDGHRVATLVYKHGLHTISVFVWPDGTVAPVQRPPGRTEGLNVLSWTRDGMVWWAVSDMEPAELGELQALL
jgi:anti-sigma factor RsiW